MDNGTSVDGLEGLDLQSLDPDSLFQALTSVEKAIPALLSCVKPILKQLAAPTSISSDPKEASEAIERYMDLLDKIQFVLRQTVYYLAETNTKAGILSPPPVGSIPTPFASTLPTSFETLSSVPTSTTETSSALHDVSDIGPRSGAGAGVGTSPGEVELGLYGRRIEARTLGELVDVLKRWGERTHQDRSRDGDEEMQDIT